MIGLRRHTVRVVEHDPAWLEAGHAECAALRQVGGGLVLDAQHVGSTAVPGLPAKPVLDVAARIPSAAAAAELVRRLTAAGYIYRGDNGDDGGHLFVRETEPDVRAAHVHVVAEGDRQWADYLGFRDLLRRDDGLRRRYGALKRELSRRYGGDRRSYTASKHTFIRQALGRP
jgi:GrpB-like predicted nucleotidyltransferase (UPF0157 family)